MAADNKLSALEDKIKFRSNMGDLIVIVKAVCKPGESVEDLLGLLDLALNNDMALGILMEKVALLQTPANPNIKK